MTRRRRTWRDLLWLGGAFFLVQLVAGLVLDYVVPGIRNPLLRLQLFTLAGRHRTPEIVCVGSSRMGCAVQDRTATAALRQALGNADVQVFNAGIPGSDPVACEPLVEQLLARPVPPRLLVLELLPESLTDRSHCVRFYIQRQATWTSWPAHWKAVVGTNNLGRLITARLLPLLAHREQIRKSLAEAIAPPPEPFPRGTAAETYSAIDWQNVIVGGDAARPDRLRVGLEQVHRELRDYAPRGPARRALERTLRRCRDAGVPVVLLGVPVASPHRDCYTPTVEAEFRNYLAHLRDAYGLEYRDYRAALPDSVFADHNHASPTGREQFSPRLVAEVLVPAWNNPPTR